MIKENSFGFYAPDAPCCMCGGHKRNRRSRRFGYVVCEDHVSTPANQVPMSAAQAAKPRRPTTP